MHPVADIFRAAAGENLREEHRRGNVVHFRSGEHMVVSGDIHGNGLNLAKVISHAAVSRDPLRMLVLQEVVHGGPADAMGGDRSFELLLRVARLKNQHPRQVHVLLANHDVAQLTGNEITKEGFGACKAFDLGLANAYGADAELVASAIDEFFRSLPLAAICPNGVFVSHSLPSPNRLAMFDPAILHRPCQEKDLKRGGSVYELVWGRHQDESTLNDLAGRLEAGLFITAHQPQENGYLVNGRQLIITSDGAQGVIAEFDADEEIDPEMLGTLVRRISRLRA